MQQRTFKELPHWLLGRWAVALVFRERDWGWILYTGVLAAVSAVAFCGGIVPANELGPATNAQSFYRLEIP